MTETRHALVVEDSPSMRQALAHAIGHIPGFKVVEAEDGVDGLKQLSKQRFDILVTDINMPMMDGLKLIAMVRRDAVHRDVPILVISTEGAKEDRQRALSLGASAYITKPIQAPAVVRAVRELLGLSET